jgi:hypothetical protein
MGRLVFLSGDKVNIMDINILTTAADVNGPGGFPAAATAGRDPLFAVDTENNSSY